METTLQLATEYRTLLQRQREVIVDLHSKIQRLSREGQTEVVIEQLEEERNRKSDWYTARLQEIFFLVKQDQRQMFWNAVQS
jgi:hypothetical protein